MSAGLIILILSALLGLQPVTTDLYLPALPALTESFGALMTHAQLTLSALQPATLVRTWHTVICNPEFLAFSALAAASYGGLFTFLASSSSFIFIKVLGLSKTQYGLTMFSMCLAYLAGTFVCRRLLPRFGVRNSVAIAAGFSLAGGTVMGLLALAGIQSAWAIMVPFYFFMLAHGVHQPCGQSGAAGPFPRAAGAASALNGCLMMLAAFAIGAWLGTHMDGSVKPMAYGVWFWSALIALAAWTVVRKYGDTSGVAVLVTTSTANPVGGPA